MQCSWSYGETDIMCLLPVSKYNTAAFITCHCAVITKPNKISFSLKAFLVTAVSFIFSQICHYFKIGKGNTDTHEYLMSAGHVSDPVC